MKPQTEKKILALIDVLRGDDAMKGVVAELHAILACEMNDVKLGKLDLYKFVSDDNIRPSITGVYHEEGWRIATDGRILLAIKQDYSPELEGRIILKNGSLLDKELRYPRWRSVIPDVMDEWKTFRLDFAELSEVLREAKAHEKVWKKSMGKHYSSSISLNGEIWLRTSYLKLFATVMKECNITEISYKDNGRGIVVKNDTLQLLLMPVCHSDEVEGCFYGTLKGVPVQEEPQSRKNEDEFEWSI